MNFEGRRKESGEASREAHLKPGEKFGSDRMRMGSDEDLGGNLEESYGRT